MRRSWTKTLATPLRKQALKSKSKPKKVPVAAMSCLLASANGEPMRSFKPAKDSWALPLEDAQSVRLRIIEVERDQDGQQATTQGLHSPTVAVEARHCQRQSKQQAGVKLEVPPRNERGCSVHETMPVSLRPILPTTLDGILNLGQVKAGLIETIKHRRSKLGRAKGEQRTSLLGSELKADWPPESALSMMLL